jgi:hypothetical protein
MCVLSYIVYGRNDNYGYNLHKRAALSLNCMADVLSHPDDEILFVDYNTPDDFPTFPEAIEDTLTDKAKRHLRILRVRPAVHARFSGKTDLTALEPIARNVGVRRSNPENRWIVSTNTDMIFVPRQSYSLTDIVSDLPKGYYGIPRFELPEALWESFDRRDPRHVIGILEQWGWQLHLNDIVLGVPSIRFDGPGDFQLIERADLFVYHGFHEGMLRGWHVDSNIAKRLYLIYAKVGDLTDRLFGYHCDHTRQVTPMHRRNAAENSLDTFVRDVSRPDVPDQAESWGCPDDDIEEIRLNKSNREIYIHTLKQLLPKPLARPAETVYVAETYDQCGYAPEHVLPFLLDLFANVPRSWSAAWIGSPGRLFDLFADGWRRLGFSGDLLIGAEPGDAAWDHLRPDEPWIRVMAPEAAIEAADAFVFDFARGDGGALTPKSVPADGAARRQLLARLDAVIEAELIRRASGLLPRRIIGVNAIHNGFERIFASYVNRTRTPFNMRIRHGYVDLGRNATERIRVRSRLLLRGLLKAICKPRGSPHSK